MEAIVNASVLTTVISKTSKYYTACALHFLLNHGNQADDDSSSRPDVNPLRLPIQFVSFQ